MEEVDTELLAISTDTKFTLKKWHEDELAELVEGGIPYPLLSDSTGEIGKKYGVYDYQAGVNLRGRFIINPEGIIKAQEVLGADVGRSAQEMIRQLKAFQHARETGEVTPSDWQPGETALSTDPDLSGRIKDEWQAERVFGNN